MKELLEEKHFVNDDKLALVNIDFYVLVFNIQSIYRLIKLVAFFLMFLEHDISLFSLGK